MRAFIEAVVVAQFDRSHRSLRGMLILPKAAALLRPAPIGLALEIFEKSWVRHSAGRKARMLLLSGYAYRPRDRHRTPASIDRCTRSACALGQNLSIELSDRDLQIERQIQGWLARAPYSSVSSSAPLRSVRSIFHSARRS